VKAFWVAVVERGAPADADRLNGLLREYSAVATLNIERRSIQVTGCGGLVANIPLAVTPTGG
jgi:hypothetical protein